MQERRKSKRVFKHLQVAYRILPGTKIKRLLTENVGQGGIKFISLEFIPKNSLLEIRLTFEKVPFSFESIVKVIWSEKAAKGEKYELGVKFENMPEEAAERLTDCISSLLM